MTESWADLYIISLVILFLLSLRTPIYRSEVTSEIASLRSR